MIGIKRPAVVLDEHLDFLSNLHKGGCNMFIAPAAVAMRFKVNKSEAMAIVGYWMKTNGGCL